MTNRFQHSRLRQTIIPLLLFIFTMALTLFYYWMFAEFSADSDSAGSYLAATDMATGNWRLKGWWWGSDSFWTSDLAFQAALIELFGNHPVIMVIVAAFDWAGVVVLSAVAALTRGSRPAFALLPIAAIVAAPVLRNNSLMSMIALVPMHIGSILYMLAMFLLAATAATAGSMALPALIALDVATFLAVAGDPLVLIVGVGAIIAVIWIIANKNKDRRKFIVLINVASAALFGKCTMVLNQYYGGIRLDATPLTFVSFENLSRNIYLAINSIFVLTGSNFFGKNLGSSILYISRFFFLLTMIWALYAEGRRFARSTFGHQQTPEVDLLDQFLIAAVVINTLAGIANSQFVDIAGARYFIPAVVFLAILTGRTLAATRWFKIFGSAALGASVLLLGYSYAKEPPRARLVPDDIKELGDFLLQRHLTNGYAGYWKASIVTAATRGAVHVAGVTPDGAGKVAPFRWVAKEDWFSGFGRRDRSFFVVVDKLDVPGGLQEGPVTATFGSPSRQYDLPAVTIDVFDPTAP